MVSHGRRIESWLLQLSILALMVFTGDPPAQAANSNPPVIYSVNSTLFGGYVYVTGYVRDDSDPTGWTVQISGNVSGTATVEADGRFWFRTPYNYAYGSGSVKTQDNDGLKSNTVHFEFYD